MSYGKVVLSYGDSLIRDSEVNILKTNQWLNDAVIAFYFEYLGTTQAETGHDSDIELYGPGITQLLKLTPNSEEIPLILGENLGKLQYAFWPVNDSSETEKASSGSHWSLLVYSKPDNKFFHFDSYGGANESAARLLYKKLFPLFSSASSFQDFEGCHSQANGRDCGLHVLVTAQNIIEYIRSESASRQNTLLVLQGSGLSTATPKQAENMRGHLLQLIKSLSNSTSSTS